MAKRPRMRSLAALLCVKQWFEVHESITTLRLPGRSYNCKGVVLHSGLRS